WDRCLGEGSIAETEGDLGQKRWNCRRIGDALGQVCDAVSVEVEYGGPDGGNWLVCGIGPELGFSERCGARRRKIFAAVLEGTVGARLESAPCAEAHLKSAADIHNEIGKSVTVEIDNLLQ